MYELLLIIHPSIFFCYPLRYVIRQKEEKWMNYY